MPSQLPKIKWSIKKGSRFCYVSNIPESRNQFSALLKICLSFTKWDISRITSHYLRTGMASHIADVGYERQQN